MILMKSPLGLGTALNRAPDMAAPAGAHAREGIKSLDCATKPGAGRQASAE